MDDDCPIECRICGRPIAAAAPRRLVPVLPDDPRMLPVMSGVACLGCYLGSGQTYVPGVAEGRLTSRGLVIPAAEFAS